MRRKQKVSYDVLHTSPLLVKSWYGINLIEIQLINSIITNYQSISINSISIEIKLNFPLK